MAVDTQVAFRGLRHEQTSSKIDTPELFLLEQIQILAGCAGDKAQWQYSFTSDSVMSHKHVAAG